MKLDELQKKLIQAGRSIPLDDRVPFAFEKRISAGIKERRVVDYWGMWANGLWRAAAPCLAICVVLVGWSLLLPEAGNGGSDFTQDLENTVLMAADPSQTADTGW